MTEGIGDIQAKGMWWNEQEEEVRLTKGKGVCEQFPLVKSLE